jgi:hypothetical protein
MKKIFKAVRASMVSAALMAAVSAANAAPVYVDIGVNCVKAIPDYIQNTGTISADTVLKYCASSTSGTILNPLEILRVYPGTAKELSIIPSGGVTQGNTNIRDLYVGVSGTNFTLSDLPMSYWKLMVDTTSPEDTYIEVKRTGVSGDISSVAVNGVSNSATAGDDVNIAILFSDNATFDSASVIGYRQVLLPPIRRGLPAQTVAAPAGTKSFRLYNTVTLQTKADKYAIAPHRTGDIVLEAGRTEIRLAYIGVEMDVPQVAMGHYVDIGVDCVDTIPDYIQNTGTISADTVLKYCASSTSEIILNPLEILQVYPGTAKELSISPSGGVTQGNDRIRDLYIGTSSTATPSDLPTRHWKLALDTISPEDTYIEVKWTSALDDISSVTVNGVSNSATAGDDVNIAILFSDNATFDSASVIGYRQVLLPPIRRGLPAQTVAAPAGTKSFRLYNTVTLQTKADKYAIVPHRTGDTVLMAGRGEIRLAYIGVMHGEGAVPKVAVSPASLSSMQTGTTEQFTASVKALGTASSSVTWSVLGATSDQTTISTSGLLTVATGDLETAAQLKVVATSDFDLTVADTAYVTLSSVPPAVNSVSVTPATITKLQGDTLQFTVEVDAEGGASTSVTWSVNGAEGTSISADGLLTISPNEPATSLTVTATSNFDSDKTGSATVTVTPLIPAVLSVTVSPAAVRVEQGDTVQFSAEVERQGGAPVTVSWSVDGSSAATAISESGLLVVGATETATTFRVIVASTVDATVADTATVMVDLPVSDSYVDWGVDLINDDHSIYGCSDKKAANTMLAYAKSGSRIRESPPGDTVYAGTEKEMIVRVEGVGSGLVYQAGSGQDAARFYIKRGATPNHPDNPDYPGEDMSSAHWRLVDGSGFFSMEVANASAERTIESVTINGTSNNSSHIDGTDHCTLTGTPPVKTTATILFSDAAPFDENSVIGYDTVSLAASRSGELAQTISAPEGTKSYRVYHTVTLAEYGEKYRINPSGNIQLTSPQEIRLGYLGATLSSLTGGTITSVSVSPDAPTVMKGIPQGFTATVEKEGPAATTVTWSIEGNASASTVIDQTSGTEGVLTVAADETASTLTVIATSTADPTKTGTATVTVAGNSNDGETAVAASSYLPLQVYPNPATGGLLTVSSEELKADDKIKIYTSTGWLAAVYSVDYPSTSISIAHLPAGMYVVKAGKHIAKLVVGGK